MWPDLVWEQGGNGWYSRHVTAADEFRRNVVENRLNNYPDAETAKKEFDAMLEGSE